VEAGGRLDRGDQDLGRSVACRELVGAKEQHQSCVSVSGHGGCGAIEELPNVGRLIVKVERVEHNG
jgi:hypothetical protein